MKASGVVFQRFRGSGGFKAISNGLSRRSNSFRGFHESLKGFQGGFREILKILEGGVEKFSVGFLKDKRS